MNKYFGRGTVVFLAVCLVYGAAKGLLESYYEAHDPAKIRVTAKITGKTKCVDTAQKTAAQKGLSSAQVDQFCECAVTRTLNSLTDQQLLAGPKHLDASSSPLAGDRFAATVGVCNAELRNGGAFNPAATPVPLVGTPSKAGDAEGIPGPLPALVPR